MIRPKKPAKIKFPPPSTNVTKEYIVVSYGSDIKIVEDGQESKDEDWYRPNHFNLADLISALKDASIPIEEVSINFADDVDYGYFYLIRSQALSKEQYRRELDECIRKQAEEEANYPAKLKKYQEDLVAWQKFIQEKKIKEAQDKLEKLKK